MAFFQGLCFNVSCLNPVQFLYNRILFDLQDIPAERSSDRTYYSLVESTVDYTSGIQPGVSEDTLRFPFLSFKMYYLIHYFGCNLFILDVDYTICITFIMYQQLWGYKVEDKLYLGVREQKRLNTTGLHNTALGYCSSK
jgi:hypothetical protein